MGLILLLVLIFLLIGALPTWPYSRHWGYHPAGILVMILIIFLILAITGHLAIL